MVDKRKREVDDECRQIQEEWSVKYFFIESADKALCVICHETVAVLNKYNFRHHYQSKHQRKYSQFERNIREEKLAKLKQSINSKRSVFPKASKQNESIRASFKVAYILAKNGKPLTDGEIIKNCLLKNVDELCLEKSNSIKTITLGDNTVARRIGDMSTNLKEQIASNAKNFVHFFFGNG
ncbi:general transcription factor II-I repeat domain-containing protein 2-like [Watersipora subatra]|uniref:general transcription factor II-I repeat domain-containing protein 2-like n=1 Tax=Watersipora subatra TaxID=2589382 RepID=UPI00355C5008